MGTEFDWLLADRRGHVAVCQTAGFGDVPLHILDRGLDFARMLEARLDELATNLPVTGVHKWSWSRIAKDPLSRALAARGFYVFGWDHSAEAYRRELRPTAPATISDLMRRATDTASVIPTIDACFARSRRLRLPPHLPCYRLGGEASG